MPKIDPKYIYKKSPENIVIEMDLHSCIMPENPGHAMTLTLTESSIQNIEGGKLFHCFLYDRYYYEDGDGYEEEILEGKEYEEGDYYAGDLFITNSEAVSAKFLESRRDENKDFILRIETGQGKDSIVIYDHCDLHKIFPYSEMTGLHENALEHFDACEGLWVYREDIIESVAPHF
jgi:hypothetical protein